MNFKKICLTHFRLFLEFPFHGHAGPLQTMGFQMFYKSLTSPERPETP
jgi:hypothetical protein